MKSILMASLLLISSYGWAQAPSIFDAVYFQGTQNQPHFLANSLIQEVETQLPPLMYQRLLSKKLKKGLLLTIKDQPQHIAGSANRDGEVILGRHLLADKQKFKKALIHELSHIYDFINWQTPEVESHAEWCQSRKAERGTLNDTTVGACDLYYELKSTISTNPVFLEVAGWPLTYLGNGIRQRSSGFLLRTPDIYEQKSPAEKFAVNMEYFLTDPEFQCRRPTLNNYFEKHFQYKPFQSANCIDYQKIVDSSFLNPEQALVHIDHSRLLEVHYLLADRGDGLSGKFGHSMFRLIMCAPHRKTVGPECRNDIASHIVLSFRAFVDTPEINNIAGLRGKYPSRLFFIPFLQVVEEYNKQELRDLESYPLNLSRSEMKSFIDRAIETHWSYKGMYYFISNNCAVESMNMLRAATLRMDLLTEAIQTPYAMKNKLANLGILNSQLLSNRSQAVKNGFLFISHEENLVKATEIIKQFGAKLKIRNYDSILALPPLERRNLFLTHLPENLEQRKKFAAAFLVLEAQAEKVNEASLRGAIYKLAKSKNLSPKMAPIIEQLMALQSGYFENRGQLTTPAELLFVGYGLPSSKEVTTLQSHLELIAKLRTESNEFRSNLYNQLFTSQDLAKVEESKDNRRLYMKSLLSNKPSAK